MTRVTAALWLALTALAFAMPSAAQTDVETWERTCDDNDATPDARVAACGSLIESEGYERVVWAYSRRGLAYRALEDHGGAVADYSAAIAIDPGDFAVYRMRAYEYSLMEDYAAAAADMEHLAAAEPDYYWNHYFLSRIYGFQDRLEEALAAVDRSLALRDGYEFALRQRAWILDDLERHADAVEAYTDAIAVDPFSVQLHYGRGGMYDALGDSTLAARDYKIALLINPNAERSRWRLEEIILLEGPPALEPLAYTPPGAGLSIRYLQAMMPRETRDEMEVAIGALADWFAPAQLATPEALADMTRTVEAVDGDAVTLSITLNAEQDLPDAENVPEGMVAYRTLQPLLLLLQEGAPSPRINYDEAELAAMWPLEAGKSVTGAATYALQCPPEPDFMMRMMGCAQTDLIPMGELTYGMSVEGTEQVHVPLGVFDTIVVRYREVGAIELFGRREERELETKWWIAPDLGFWVRRTHQQGDFIVITEATYMASDATEDTGAGDARTTQ